jgi:hypothetical protein
MQPAVFTVFNRGIQLAGHLLHDVQPVASATGKALGGMLGQIDAEFQSGTWQDFFGFMARTAGPDVQLLSQDFTGLLNILPPLLEGLQGVATEILKDAGGIFRLIGGIEALVAEEQHLKQAATDNTGVLGALGHAVGQAFGQMFPGAQAAKKVADNLGLLGENAAPAAKNVKAIVTPVWSLNTAVAALNTSMDTLVGNLLTLQGGNLSWKQAMQSATSQLKSNSAGLAGNSKNALANKQAVLQVTQQALAFAHQELTTGHNIGGASQTIQAQIKWLQGLHDKSAFVRNEIEALRKEEARLQAEHVNQTINVQGLGHWSVSQSLAPGAGHRRAAGGLIPGTGSGDTYPALLTPGEVVVPRPMVSAGAVDHLRGRLPGFAAGGIVPSYSGAVAGMPPWVRGNDQATIRLIDLAVVKATAAGIKSAQTAALAAMTSSRVGGHFGGGVQQWAGLVSRALAMEGLSPMLLGRVLYQMQTESGGNPNAINLTDSNAAAGDPSRGLMQTIGSTFRAYHWPGTSSNIYDPLANIAAALNYARHRYGPSLMSGGMGIGSGHGYDSGGFLPPGLSLAYNGTGRPEAVIPSRGGAAQPIVLEVAPGGEGALTAALLNVLRKQIRIRGGDVQGALGRL